MAFFLQVPLSEHPSAQAGLGAHCDDRCQIRTLVTVLRETRCCGGATKFATHISDDTEDGLPLAQWSAKVPSRCMLQRRSVELTVAHGDSYVFAGNEIQHLVSAVTGANRFSIAVFMTMPEGYARQPEHSWLAAWRQRAE